VKDANGRTIEIGDRIKAWEGHFGTVVCDIEGGQGSEKYPWAQWEYLAKGVLVEMDSGELIHYGEADEDFELI
jgi:hypothetical protein